MGKDKITSAYVRERLKENEDADYRVFHSRLVPETENILGVRLPVLRKIAKEIGENDWQEWFEEAEAFYYEETMLKGLVAATAKLSCEERIVRVRQFVPRIDNWAVCDSFCNSLKDAGKYPELYWDFLEPYFTSDEEYDARFGAVMLLSHFVKKECLKESVSRLELVHQEGYYAKMGVAWAISVYFAAFPQEMYEYLVKYHNLDEFTYKKSLQKILESYRVTGDMKNKIRELRQRG